MKLESKPPRPPSSCCKLTLEVDTLLAAVPLSVHRFRPELLHVLNTLDGAAVAVLVCVFCVCLYVTVVTSVFGWPVCQPGLSKSVPLCSVTFHRLYVMYGSVWRHPETSQERVGVRAVEGRL